MLPTSNEELLQLILANPGCRSLSSLFGICIITQRDVMTAWVMSNMHWLGDYMSHIRILTYTIVFHIHGMTVSVPNTPSAYLLIGTKSNLLQNHH